MTTAQEKINRFVSDTLRNNRQNEYSFVVIGDVPLKAIEEVYRKFKIDLTGYKYVIDTICVTHILDKRHGVRPNDRTPLLPSELTLIPLILTEFNSVELGNNGPNGTKRLIFKKNVTSEYYYVTIQYLIHGRKSLACVTLRNRETS